MKIKQLNFVLTDIKLINTHETGIRHTFDDLHKHLLHNVVVHYCTSKRSVVLCVRYIFSKILYHLYYLCFLMFSLCYIHTYTYRDWHVNLITTFQLLIE